MHYGAWLRDRGVDLERFFNIHDYDHYGPWSLPEELHGSTWVADRSNRRHRSRQGQTLLSMVKLPGPSQSLCHTRTMGIAIRRHVRAGSHPATRPRCASGVLRQPCAWCLLW
jgi:hypothetical protein